MRQRKFSTPEKPLTDAETYCLKGPVKQVMEITYKAHLKNNRVEQGKLEIDTSGGETNFIITFNKKGTKIFEQKYGSSFYQTERFNDAGQHLENTTYYKGKLSSKVNFMYNEAGKVTEYVGTDEKGEVSHRHTNTYNDLGQTLESAVVYTKNPKLNNKTVYTYEDVIRETNGIRHRQALSIINYKSDGSVVSKYLYTYNDKGLRIESRTEYTDEKQHYLNQHSTQKYNDHGDCIEYTTYNADGSVKDVQIYTPEYDSDGKRIIPPHTPYDPYALKPGETEEFENDHHGNWIKMTTFFEKKPVNIVLRQISYYGEESEKLPDFIHPVTYEEADKIEDISNNVEPLTPEQAKWLAEGTAASEQFPLHRYYALMFNELPSVVSFGTSTVEAFALLSLLEENLNARIIHSTTVSWRSYRGRYNRYSLTFKYHPGYILTATGISSADAEEYIIPTYIEKLIRHEDNIHFSQFQLLRPSEASGKRDDYLEESLFEYLDECTLQRKPEKPYINIVEVAGNNFVMAEHPVDDDFEIRDLNINYGYGFEQFHNDLMQRFNSSTKGLVLFHGEPGTGKTYYIRHLLRKMVANKKVVIYMPPNMVDHLVEPGFMTFLMQQVRNWSSDGNFCVLLIEDAEPLLAKRQEGVRIQGVTNLLNLSDGLLNDMLNLQIICTFNVDLKKLDSALLRPGRLIARKEFKALGELDANLLAQRLGIKHHFKKPATLSEIYAMRKNQNTLIHDVEQDRDASSILDDL